MRLSNAANLKVNFAQVLLLESLTILHLRESLYMLLLDIRAPDRYDLTSIHAGFQRLVHYVATLF